MCVNICALTSVCLCLCSPGFQVVGGENSGRMDLGTIISSVTPGGPADVNGCLKPGKPVFAALFASLRVDYDVFLSAVMLVSRCMVVFLVYNSCNVNAGDRLISVNDVNLQGLSHANTIDILHNAPDDVTLVVSQPKERLYKGNFGDKIIVAMCAKLGGKKQ